MDPDPGRALLFAYATALNHPTRDLAWLRTARWRSRISATFATTEALGTLAFRPSAEIIGNVQQPAAILLAAWVASRVHINVSLRQGSGADPVEAVTVAGIVINAGSGSLCDESTLAAALDTLYAAPLGYETALAALDRVAILA